MFGEVKVIGDRCYVFILAGCCFGWASVPPGTIGYVLPCRVLCTRALLWLCLPLLPGSCLWSVAAARPLPGCLWFSGPGILTCLPCILLDAFTNFLWLLLMHYLVIWLYFFMGSSTASCLLWISQGFTVGIPFCATYVNIFTVPFCVCSSTIGILPVVVWTLFHRWYYVTFRATY